MTAGIYSAFLRGLFEADGTVQEGVPSLSTAIESFAAEIRTALLALGLATTTRETVSGWGGPIFQVRLRNVDHALNFDEIVGFISERKSQPDGLSGAGRVGQEGLRLPAPAGLE